MRSRPGYAGQYYRDNSHKWKTPEAHARKREYNRRYYIANKDKLRVANKAWNTANRERKAARAKEQTARIRVEPRERARWLLRGIRTRCAKFDLPFNLTLDDILPAIARGTCDATGLPFVLSADKGRDPWTPSVDRREPAKGYIKGNVQVVVWALNAARGNWGDEVLFAIVDAMRASRGRDCSE